MLHEMGKAIICLICCIKFNDVEKSVFGEGGGVYIAGGHPDMDGLNTPM